MIPFQVREIADPKCLFGRSGMLESLKVSAYRNANLNVVGIRRFGKTCVMKSLISLLKEDENTTVYPIYLDFKSSEIIGTDNVYKYMLSVFLSSLFLDGANTDKINICGNDVMPSGIWEDIYEQISASGLRLHRQLSELVSFFSEMMEKTVLFIIDEYEFLFVKALERPEGFMKIRNLGAQINKNGHRIFAYWLVGSITWDKLCDSIGSPAANTITETSYITPLDKESFLKWWQYELSFESDTILKGLLEVNAEIAYEKSGGVPYYGIKIAEYLIKYKQQPDYSILLQSFKDMMSRCLSPEEQKVLEKLKKGPQNISSLEANQLYEKGIIQKINKKNFSIRIAYLQEYVNSLFSEKNATNAEVLRKLVKDIVEYMKNINDCKKNKCGEYVFKPDNAMSSWEEVLRTECLTRKDFESFVNSLYKMFFERAKENEKGDLLPNKFRYGNFAKCLDTARHGVDHAQDSYIVLPGQLKRSEMLQIVNGNLNEPFYPSEYSDFQLNFMRLFLTELKNMLEYVRTH